MIRQKRHAWHDRHEHRIVYRLKDLEGGLIENHAHGPIVGFLASPRLTCQLK
jgi:hypothetical protein